jgi:phosphomannomutase
MPRTCCARCPATIIADVKALRALFERVAALGGKALDVEDRAQPDQVQNEGGWQAPLAGEMSGHVFFAHDYYGFDDALYAAIRLIAASARLGKSVTELRGAMPALVNTPELRFQVDEAASSR